MFTGKKKTEYQREYMRKRRAAARKGEGLTGSNKGSAAQAKAAAPTDKIDPMLKLEAQLDIQRRLNAKLEDENRRLRNRHKGVMTQALFSNIRACLRPDFREKNITDEKLTKTRMEFEALEKVLVKPK